MARSHATIYGTAWSPDSHFRELPAEVQWLYVVLLAQPDLNLCGVMPLIPARWARFAADMDIEKVGDLIHQLEHHGYIVTDPETVELWVRSFMYHDRVFAQPQVAMAAATAFGQVQSPRLRQLVLDAVPPALRDGWPENLRSIKRDEAKKLLEECDAASWKPSVTPSTSPNGSPSTRGDREALTEALAEGSGYGLGSGSGNSFLSKSSPASHLTPSEPLARVERLTPKAGGRGA